MVTLHFDVVETDFELHASGSLSGTQFLIKWIGFNSVKYNSFDLAKAA